MRITKWVGMLWLGLALLSPSFGRAQQAAAAEPARVPAPGEIKPAPADQDDRTGGAVVGGIVGAAVGVGLVSLLYVATEPDGPSAHSVELHGPGGEGGYEKLGHVLLVLVVGVPLLAATTAAGIWIGVNEAAKKDPAAPEPPKPVDRALRIAPLASVSPDGGYVGARVTF